MYFINICLVYRPNLRGRGQIVFTSILAGSQFFASNLGKVILLVKFSLSQEPPGTYIMTTPFGEIKLFLFQFYFLNPGQLSEKPTHYYAFHLQLILDPCLPGKFIFTSYYCVHLLYLTSILNISSINYGNGEQTHLQFYFVSRKWL